MGEPESISHPKFARDRILGRCGIPRFASKSPGVCGHRLRPWMGGDSSIRKYEVSKFETTGN